MGAGSPKRAGAPGRGPLGHLVKWLTNPKASYRVAGYRLAFGAQNLFDVFPDRNITVNSFNGIQNIRRSSWAFVGNDSPTSTSGRVRLGHLIRSGHPESRPRGSCTRP